ncbi:MAG: DUF1573 domain-containing protein [bacterium]|nr:DUF1573 domain-containing protein [bacterium]
MNKTLSIALVILLIFLVIFWAGKTRNSAPIEAGVDNSSSNLVADQNSFDFGTISMADGNVEKIFTVTNSSASDVTINKITTSCMCTVSYLESGDGEKGPFGMPGHSGPTGKVNETVAPGESRKVRVVFDPNAHGPAGIGEIIRAVYLESQSGGALELRFRAVVTP